MHPPIDSVCNFPDAFLLCSNKCFWLQEKLEQSVSRQTNSYLVSVIYACLVGVGDICVSPDGPKDMYIAVYLCKVRSVRYC